ncbi:cytochrome c1 [Legionella jordanis]|nr:cytochrome c1 [Legionella jordanis]
MQSGNIDVQDQAKLQRGAKIFMNYCSGCHSLRYMRYNRMAEDLGLTTFSGEIDEDLLFNNLIFTSAKITEPIQIAMPETSARQWFGNLPPDLSLKVRERGADWIYTFLKSFYVDKTRPFGSNNLLLPDLAMPNVLEPLRGEVIAVRQGTDVKSPISHLVLLKRGEMSQPEFDSMLDDLISFLSYVAEPAKLVRYRIGVLVLAFLFIFLVIAYQLKKAYWKKIH